VIPPLAPDPAGEFCIPRCVNRQLLREETLLSAAPMQEVSPGSSLPAELVGVVLLPRQEIQLDPGTGSAWITTQTLPKPRLPTSYPVKTQTVWTRPIYSQ